MLQPVAAGFRDHTGWAVAVVLGGPVAKPEILRRITVELVEPHLPRQVYHAIGSGAAPREALGEVEASVRAATKARLRELADELRDAGLPLGAIAVARGTQVVPADLDCILASHTLLHTAEGELYRECLADAAAELGIETIRFAQKELARDASDAIGIDPEALASRLSAMGRPLGPPWQKDHREAAQGAWIGLAKLEAAQHA